MQAVCDHVQWMLEDLARARTDHTYKQRAQNLLINIPPRASKSLICAVFAPAWAWLHWPDLKIRCISTNPRVTWRDSRKCRELIGSNWYQQWFEPEWQIRTGEVDALQLFANTARGERYATPFNARIIGEGTDVLILDDPHDANDVKESDYKRELVLDRWDTSIYNRVNDQLRCVRIGVMQRLHEEDWAGHVLKGDDWEHLCIPMEFEPDRACSTVFGWRDPRTVAGELMQPERFPREFCENEKGPHRLGAYGYAGQMQQRPAPAGGGMFRDSWWRFWKPDGVAAPDACPRPENCYLGPARAIPRALLDPQAPTPKGWRKIISMDATFKDQEHNDWVVITVWGVCGADWFLLERVRRHAAFVETAELFKAVCARHPRAGYKLVEAAANGPAVLSYFKGKIPGLVGVNPEGGKQARAAVSTPYVEGGNVYLPDGAPWLGEWVEEFGTFPRGAHDDQVDSFTQAIVHELGNPLWRLEALGVS